MSQRCLESCPPDCHLLDCPYFSTAREPAIDVGAIARVRAYAAAYDLVPRNPLSAVAKRIGIS